MEREEEYGFPYSTLVLIATLNEEKGIEPTLAELREVMKDPKFLVVDGNSIDATVRIAKDMGADVLLQEGRGKGDAISQAIQNARSNAKYVVFIDADFTYPATYLPEMIKILEENPDVGMVCGNRFNSHFHLKAMRHINYLGNRFLAFTHNLFNGVQLRDPLTGLRVVRWDALKGWKPKSKGFDFEVELNHFVEKKGFLIEEVPIHYRQRLGRKKLGAKHGFTILKRILTESF